jgi:hypothetical protein
MRACGIVTCRPRPGTASGEVHLIARRLVDHTPMLGRLASASRDLQ